jgi:four helix bundle protein
MNRFAIADWRLPIVDESAFAPFVADQPKRKQSTIALPIGDCRFVEKLELNQRELKARTKAFALRIIKLVEALPKTISGRAIGNQLVRCGTGVGSNYRACCRGRSRAEFIAKIGVVEEEADESAFWMELIIEGGLLPASKVEALLKEANELVAIMASSRISAKQGKQSAIGNRKSEI